MDQIAVGNVKGVATNLQITNTMQFEGHRLRDISPGGVEYMKSWMHVRSNTGNDQISKAGSGLK